MEVTTIIVFCYCLFSFLIISSAGDTINANQTISDGETVVSERGEFEMGFFSPHGRPKNRYFGIWYKKISTGTVVWVANRETPIINTTGVISVSDMGIVLGTNESTGIIWSSNYSRSVENPIAQLLDTGNLVFRNDNENENDEEYWVWQSFSYPTDNMLPSMKFGFVRGMTTPLRPWKSEDDPSPGDYTFKTQHTGYPQTLLWKDSVILFRSGPWVGSRFSGTPTLGQNGFSTNNVVISEKESYNIFSLVNTSESAITRVILTSVGDILQLKWNKQNREWAVYLTKRATDCDIYGYCGTNGVCNTNKTPRCDCLKGYNPKNPKDWAATDWSSGCSRNVHLDCANGDGFLKYSGVKLPDTQWSWYNKSMNLAECKSVCLKNCSCTAYSNIDVRNGGSGCLLWFGDLIDIKGYSEDAEDLYVRMAASELSSSYTEENKNSSQKMRLKMIVISVFVPLTVILGLLFLYAFKNRWPNRKGVLQINEKKDLDLPLFDFKQIANATDNFSNNNKLGAGGFGTVYKGLLKEGHQIAVKRLSKDSRQGVVEFMNEVSCIAKLQHKNLVKLHGCCIDEGERMLIYEYMPNKSLDSFIFDKEMCESFDWPMRYNIINGIARGLLYLHHDSRLRIIHRDLKASNILLDYRMNPKISDFGLARIFGESETQASTTRVVGTFGYMPPEYVIDGLFSVKSDVYSYGILLLEIISGKKNRSFQHPEHNLNLTGHAWRSYNEGNLLNVVDSVILKSSNEHEVFRVIQIGLLCVQEYPEDRPDMSTTFLMLTSNNVLPTPKQPGFFSGRRYPGQADSSSSNPASLNSVSLSFYAPR